MKIVTYNVNGLRQRVSQFGSLRKLLDSFDADVVCIQETKLRRQELTSDLAIADGYESFFSCTRTFDKGRTGYSGVATFCRVKSAFSSNEVALPVDAEEGITGLLECSRGEKCGKEVEEGEFSRDELLKVDSEGRCVITDHGHFVLFNLYGPRADPDDKDRVLFKRRFYKILEKRWESLLKEGRRVFVVGDLNIAPTAMDRCEAGPDFENNEFRRWLRSILVGDGGLLFDVFRAKHPNRREAYTCWPSNSGAEQFNYGSRIDHILCSGRCLHQEFDMLSHNFLTCHVKDCDILTQYKRWKNDADFTPRWKGGLSTKLEGSDHAPVFISLEEIPDISPHSTPSLSSRYLPGVRGLQQTLVSMLIKRQVAKPVESCSVSGLNSDGDIISQNAGSDSGRKSNFTKCSTSSTPPDELCHFVNQEPETTILQTTERLKIFRKPSPVKTVKKRNRKNKSSQLSLMSFFQKSPKVATDLSVDSPTQPEATNVNCLNDETPLTNDFKPNSSELDSFESSQEQDEINISCSEQKDKKDVALLEWQRIQQLMQNSIPFCKGHKEPCVARVVKKQGPTFGRRFYVCARAEGPSSNPEANCGYFKWASAKSRHK
ncbi:hypothetical protein ACFE04_022491 [Oxalis oulophora]